MYRIEMSDSKVMGSFISINDVDYVDVFLCNDKVKFVTNSAELFAELELPVTKSKGEENFQFRIHKKTLASMVTGDYLILSKESDRISASFYNEYGVLNYACSFDQQVVAEGSYAEKMELAEQTKEGMTFDVSALTNLGRVAKTSTGVINVDRRVASVFLRNGARVYREVDTPMSFAVTSKALDALRKSNCKVISVRDFLLARNDGFYVMATKTRLTTNEEYDFIKEFGAKFVATVGLGSLFRFMSKLKIISDLVELRVGQSDCLISDSHYEYKVPIVFKGAQLAPGAECDSIAVPLTLLTGTLAMLGYNEFNIRVTKNFTQLTADKYTVVW